MEQLERMEQDKKEEFAVVALDLNGPSSLIQIVDGKPQWLENKCVRCMACLKCTHVQFHKKSKKRRRYSFEKYNK